MKKMLNIAIVLIAAGCVLLGVLLATGKFDIKSLIDMDRNVPFMSFGFSDYQGNRATSEDGVFYKEYTNIKEIHIDAEMAEIEYLISDDEIFRIEAQLYHNDRIEESVSHSGSLEIELECKGNGCLSRRKVSVLKIFVPKDVLLDVVEINNSLSSITIKEINVRRLEIDSDMASITIVQANVEHLEVETSMADFHFSGVVKNRAEVSNSMGNITMDINASEQEVGYYIENSMGSVVVGNRSHSGFDGTMRENENAPIFLELKNSMGNIEVKFQKQG